MNANVKTEHTEPLTQEIPSAQYGGVHECLGRSAIVLSGRGRQSATDLRRKEREKEGASRIRSALQSVSQCGPEKEKKTGKQPLQVATETA